MATPEDEDGEKLDQSEGDGSSETTVRQTSTVFISYSHSDSRWKEHIVESLCDAYPEFKDILWDDSKLRLGSLWADELARQRSQATAALLLISEAYLASRSVRAEISDLIVNRDGRGLPLIPILLSDCAWQGEAWLRETQIYPAPDRPLATLSAADLAEFLADFANQLIALVRARKKRLRRLVILVHGIRTQAEWQGPIRHLFESDGHTTVEPAGYEYFDVFRFLCPFWTRRRPVEVVLGKVREAIELHRNKYDELVIVAHSFGTYILGKILEDNPEIKPERVLLCGSILRASYRWRFLPNRPRVILNEAGSRDIWPILAKSVTWGYGSTGTFGFKSPGIRDRFHDAAHSDYFKDGFAEKYWVKWIQDEQLELTQFDKSRRPPTPFYKNVLEVIPLKYLFLIAACVALILFARKAQKFMERVVTLPPEVPYAEDQILGTPSASPRPAEKSQSDQKWEKTIKDSPKPIQMDPTTQKLIATAGASRIARYSWTARGVVPIGYVKGMAMAYAFFYCKLILKEPGAVQMARAANAKDSANDALAFFQSQFDAAKMDNGPDGEATLRRLFVLLYYLGIRESSGRYCEGRDTAASGSVSAGLFQTDYSIATKVDSIDALMIAYAGSTALLDIFKEGVIARDDDLRSDFGTAPARGFQRLSKACPAFAIEVAAIGVRAAKDHWGPLAHKNIEIRAECDEMFKAIKDVVDQATSSDSIFPEKFVRDVMNTHAD